MPGSLTYTGLSSEISVNAGQIQECSDELANSTSGLDEEIFVLGRPEFPGIPTQMHADFASDFQRSLAALTRNIEHDARALDVVKDTFTQADNANAQAIRTGVGHVE